MLPLLLVLTFGMTGALVNTWASLALLVLLASSFPLPGSPAVQVAASHRVLSLLGRVT